MEQTRLTMKNNVLALAAAVGGVVGYLAFRWIAQHGFYALVLPGALVGIAAGCCKSQSLAVCVVCGLLALAVGLFAEWRHAPFLKDDGLGYFLAHAHQLRPMTLLMIALGTGIGFGVPFRHRDDPEAG
jgi:hypothetical protein